MAMGRGGSEGWGLHPHPAKVLGRGWGKILAPHHGAGRGGAGMGLDILDPPRVAKCYNCKFFIS